MSAHEPRITHSFFNERINDLKPILDSDASDSASLDAAFELLVQTDRDLPMAKSMIIPEAWSNRPDMSGELKNMYAYCNAVIEPWEPGLSTYGKLCFLQPFGATPVNNRIRSYHQANPVLLASECLREQFG